MKKMKSSTSSQSSSAGKTCTPMKPSETKSNSLTLNAKPGKSRDRVVAELALSGVGNSATVAVGFSKITYGELSLNDCVTLLIEKGKAVQAGDLANAETMLMSQAVALDAVFASLAQRSLNNMGHYVETADRYMRLALKAQGQCRATLETLAAIKNPPVVIARQANVSNGPQQVNNTLDVSHSNIASSTRARACAE